MKPTNQQENIIGFAGNSVIIASPGSGKTFVVSEKIKLILQDLHHFQGVVAISYTNKASNELKDRSLKNGIDPKSSFFGTIDRFFVSEIIIPFGKMLFGLPQSQITVIKINELPDIEQAEFEGFSRETSIENITKEQADLLVKYFLRGILPIETIGVFGNYVFSKSEACKQYIKSRYKYIFIDEYQDAGVNQHQIFLKITELGVIGVSVGDLNQSIYAFSGKDSRFLQELSANKAFKLFNLTVNHRCHPSIINYSNYLLNTNTEIIKTDQNNVCFFRVEGNETKVANWIDKVIPAVEKEFGIKDAKNIGILTRNTRTAELINDSLKHPHKLSLTTDLDLSLNVWSGIFSNLLRFVFDKSFKFIEVINEFTTYDRISKVKVKSLIKLKNFIPTLFENNLNPDNAVKAFTEVAEIIAPNSFSKDSEIQLRSVLNSKIYLASYEPPHDGEINIMTLHKSKGLEFDAVFHLDLHEWILPQKSIENNDWDNPRYSDWTQDINLHYVGITRAKNGCILVSSTKRTNGTGETKNGNDSEFLWKDDIKSFRRFTKVAKV